MPSGRKTVSNTGLASTVCRRTQSSAWISESVTVTDDSAAAEAGLSVSTELHKLIVQLVVVGTPFAAVSVCVWTSSTHDATADDARGPTLIPTIDAIPSATSHLIPYLPHAKDESIRLLVRPLAKLDRLAHPGVIPFTVPGKDQAIRKIDKKPPHEQTTA